MIDWKDLDHRRKHEVDIRRYLQHDLTTKNYRTVHIIAKKNKNLKSLFRKIKVTELENKEYFQYTIYENVLAVLGWYQHEDFNQVQQCAVLVQLCSSLEPSYHVVIW